MGGKRKRCSEISNIAHKLQRRENGNIAHKLQRREIGNRWALRNTHSQIKFRNFELQVGFDLFNFQYINHRSMIEEIVSGQGIIFALAESGVCAAFDRHTNKRFCYLNLSPQEVIRNMFYNKKNDSLITVSSYVSDRVSMKCRTTPLEYIRRAQPDAGFDLFENEKIWPGFVEFDDINGKVLTYSLQDHTYKIFDLNKYTLLFSLSDNEIEQIKTTLGKMLLISKRSACGSILPLKILSIEDGTVLKSINHSVLPDKKMDFVELFHEKVLLKQESECLQMIDVENEKIIEVSKEEFKKPSTVIFLYGKRLFLSFYGGDVFAWNLQGELVASYRDHLVMHPGCNVHLTNDEEMFISYRKVCKSDKRNGSIRINHSLTGKCCAKIDVGLFWSRPNASPIQSTFQDALEDITAFFYDQERNEIYTGDTRGFLHVWSN
ncbi:hypothetical protein SUGI_1172200 [Cryptomeria japonica]|uniref:uncharacterized protein LOC131068257 n=1 Tax=Cryptomeria japonica TaxID=3369 RepID=UPI002414984B|nr:uncharacterized protein LOC131068257 [Cryptomeria japonica]GLJ54574.1 hypothetical protein SUGI_1172200 [Cryptomeria japonica]